MMLELLDKKFKELGITNSALSLNDYKFLEENEHDLLMNVINGYFMNEDGSYKSEFFDILNELKKKLDYAKNNTSLQKEPNYKKVEEFVIETNKKIILNS
jgi:hypothetical protein